MAAFREVDVGDKVRMSVEFRDLDGALADPDTVTAKSKDPSGNVTTISATKDGTGIYHADIPVDEAGDWYARMAGTGAVEAAFEGKFVARPTQF